MRRPCWLTVIRRRRRRRASSSATSYSNPCQSAATGAPLASRTAIARSGTFDGRLYFGRGFLEVAAFPNSSCRTREVSAARLMKFGVELRPAPPRVQCQHAAAEDGQGDRHERAEPHGQPRADRICHARRCRSAGQLVAGPTPRADERLRPRIEFAAQAAARTHRSHSSRDHTDRPTGASASSLRETTVSAFRHRYSSSAYSRAVSSTRLAVDTGLMASRVQLEASTFKALGQQAGAPVDAPSPAREPATRGNEKALSGSRQRQRQSQRCDRRRHRAP